MSTAPSLRHSVALMLLSATVVFAADDGNDNTDFLLNAFSDIGPILALFGEQFARQFLSETFTWEDHVIFACIPLGIMTAISGAIRVQGHNFFKAVIGRARENHAAAEIEYMSSTSTEVCELYNGEGIGIMDYQGNTHRGWTSRGLSDNLTTYYRVESRPRFFKWFEPSPKPAVNSPNSTRSGTERSGDLETGTNRSEGAWNLDGQDPLQQTSDDAGMAREELSRSPGIQERPQGTSGNGRNPSRGQQSSQSPTQDGQNSEKKNHWLTLRSPNLQLNIPSAVVALILQIALLVIAVSTVYFISGFEPEPWGLPCYVGGSILLFLGMLACSVAIEKRTRELTRYRPNGVADSGQQREKFHLLWVQRNQRVSEQDFDSYIIDGGTRRHIMTSSRHEDPEGLDRTPPPAPESRNGQAGSTDTPSGQQKGSGEDSKLSLVLLLPLVAVLFGRTGFTVQFIGLRGLPWPCAVSQLGAMIIMAIIRALIRRRLAKRLDSRPVLQNHELDYLAIQLVEKNGKLFDDIPDRNLSPGKRWDIRAMVRSVWERMFGRKNDRKHQPSTEVLVWKVDTASDITFEPREESGAESTDAEVELVFKPCHNTTAIESDPLPTPADSHGSETTHTNDPGSETAHTDEGQRTILVRKRLGDLCKWPNSTSKSALALTLSIERFMNEFFSKGLLSNDSNKLTWKIPFSRSHTSAQNTRRSSSNQTNVSWIKLDVTMDPIAKIWRVDNGQVEAALSLWVAHWTAHRAEHLETDGEADGSDGQKKDWRRSGDGSHVEYCRRVGENRNGVLKRDISWWVNNAVEGLQEEPREGRDGPHDDTSLGSKEGRFNFGFNSVKASSSFNTFGNSATSISSKVSVSSKISGSSKAHGSSVTSRGSELPDRSELSGSTGSFKFLVQYSTADLVTVMAQHLFTCLIWNIGSLLPKNLLNRGDVNINEFVKVESSRLFDLPSSIRAQSGRRLSHRKLTKFVNYAEKQGLGTPDDILLCIIPTLSFFDCLPNNILFKDFSDFLRILSPFYNLKRRLEALKVRFRGFEICTDIASIWSTDWNERERDGAFMYKIGFTSRHLRVVNLKPDRRQLNLRTLFIGVKDGTERDIFGWTPLHYAAARPELKFKPAKGTSQPETKDSQLETKLNNNIQTYRWVDKFR
ncbi:serine threonine protein phosphatase [Fusarium langsethiae]|uniref:Serine threonine protein phosphatase n=1 Tax=Fusarium langsethiae TaxID=179993 RepID=A0A0M9ETH7_FUSLA|nr:serine threonine protein phosphatase [Fusarium langsethiae]GKU04917.1 unnamed protein product [Fusarium langsethiae]